MHRLNIHVLGSRTTRYRDALKETLHYRSLTCVKNVNIDRQDLDLDIITLNSNSSKQKTHCAVSDQYYTTKRPFSCGHSKGVSASSLCSAYRRKWKSHEPLDKDKQELENQKKSETTPVLPIAAQILYNVGEDGERVDKDTQNVLALDEDVDADENILKQLAEEIHEAQDAMEVTSVDEEYDDDDNDDYVEEITFITKSEAAALEKNEKLKSAQLLFGTPDATVPISDIPCCGCGAMLHCKDPGIPGYLPSQRYKQISNNKLRETTCQRCTLMNEHNIALNVSVQPEEYRKIVGKIKDERALCLLVVDIMDPENSIFPGLMDLIGKQRPLYIVGNKVDLLPKDEKGYLGRARQTLIDICRKKGIMSDAYVHHVSLVSGKTGYGIEELVSKLMKDWSRRGDLYILGCTNVGKSTIFNALLGSDYCRSTASEFISRATTCKWPGTTLNLLKFPIVDPSPKRLKKRAERLAIDRGVLAKELRQQDLTTKGDKRHNPTLTGRVGRTYTAQDSFTLPSSWAGHTNATYTYNAEKEEFIESGRPRESLPQFGFQEGRYKNSQWCFDTPGVVNPQQIINIMTQKELASMLASKVVVPRTVTLKPTRTLFITGLARIDHVKCIHGDNPVYVTFIGNTNLPMHVVNDHEIDDFYREHIGSAKFGVPLGGAERLQKLPSLIGKEFTVAGEGWKQSAMDITLSSLGWVAITGGRERENVLRVFTPRGLGLFARRPSLLPYAINLRGKRIRGTVRYTLRPNKPIVYEQEYVQPYAEKFFGKHQREKDHQNDSSKRTDRQQRDKYRDFSRTEERYRANDGQRKMTEEELSQILSQQDSQSLTRRESPKEIAYRHYSQY